MSDPLSTADEVAARIGMSTDWVYAEVRAGRIPHLRLGRYVRFRDASIDEWLRDLERGRLGGSEKRRGAAGTAPGMAQGEKAP